MIVDARDLASDRDFAALTDMIARERGFRCGSYKERCLQRRIAVRMRARGVHAYRDYMRILEADEREFDLLLDALTINVTKLFRNWDVFDAIARSVIPELWTRLEGPIHVWSAGCASGEEPYSLAILFHRHAAERGELSRLGRVTIHATDIDRRSLDTAGRARYGAAAFGDTPPELRAAYFSAEEPAQVAPEARRLVRLVRHDLLLDLPPAPELHLIVCRNVIIYFDRATQESLFERFHDALAPGGYLVLGKVETLLGSVRPRLAAVHPRERIFRRP